MHRLCHTAISKNLLYKTMKLRFLQKAGSIGADLISADLMFQWVGTTTEKILFLVLTEHACPTRLGEMGSCNRRQVDLSCPSLLFPSSKEGKPHLPELHFSYLVLVQPTTNYRQLFDVKLRCRRAELVSMYFTLNFQTIVDLTIVSCC